MAARPGRVPRMRRPVDDGEARPRREREALAGLEPRVGDGVEPGEQDARGEGAVEDEVRGDDAAEAEDRQRRAPPSQPLRPHTDEQAEGDDEAGGDDGGGEEADDQVAAGKAQAVERPGERDADDEREDGRERSPAAS